MRRRRGAAASQACVCRPPFSSAPMHLSQRRHAPQPDDPPTTSPAAGFGEPARFPSGAPEGRSPLESALTMKENNPLGKNKVSVQDSPGSVRNSAP